jgi:PadR family transcriptional regulator, regulatory protein PadR
MDEPRVESEMNRGFLQILALVVLERPMYGYQMLRLFEESGYGVEENTLYPLLRRLESRSLVSSNWEVTGDRPKKFYQVTDAGRRFREELLRVWREQNEILTKLREANHE